MSANTRPCTAATVLGDPPAGIFSKMPGDKAKKSAHVKSTINRSIGLFRDFYFRQVIKK